MSQSYRLKIERPSLKLKVSARIPAQFQDGVGISITKSDGVYTADLDYTDLVELGTYDPELKLFAVYDSATGLWNTVTLASLINGGAQSTQIVTAAGDVNVANTDGLILLNKTVGEATNVNLPAADDKVGPVKIVDWKNDAGTNNSTLLPNGTEKIQGLSQWVLGADGASIVLHPVPGMGYAV